MAELIVITHRDSDGAIAAALAITASTQDVGDVKLLTASPTSLLKTIGYALMKGYSGNLIITDIAPTMKCVYAAAAFDSVVWYDHHLKVEEVTPPPNVEMHVVEGAESAAGVVARTLDIESPLVKLADEIDTNRVSSMEARVLRGIVGYINTLPPRDRDDSFQRLVSDLAVRGVQVVGQRPYVDWFQRFQDMVSQQLPHVISSVRERDVNGYRVGVFMDIMQLPIYAITNELEEKGDLYDVMVFRMFSDRNDPQTKLEFRTHRNRNVHKLAEMLGGGGHRLASGATIPGEMDEESIFSLVETAGKLE